MKDNVFEDKTIVLKLSLGDHLAFKRLYNHYSPILFRIALNVLRSHDIASDLVQDIFQKLWDHRSEFKNIENIDHYLKRWAKFRIINYLKDIEKRQLHNSNYKIEYEFLVSLNDDKYEKRIALIHELIETLPYRQRTLIKKCRLEGLSHEDVAKELGISSSTVNNHITTALKKMREIVK